MVSPSDVAINVKVNGGKQAEGALLGVAASLKKISPALAAIGVGAVGLTALTKGITASIQQFGKFDTAMRQVSAAANLSDKDFNQLSDTARQMGLTTGVGATAAAQGMEALAKAGVKAKEIGPALEGVIQLSQAGGVSTELASNAAANALNVFDMSMTQTKVIAEGFANAAQSTTADVGDFSMAMTQGAAAANAAGWDFQATTAALAALAKEGVKGSDAGTSLKTSLTYLAKPSDKVLATMKKMGLEFWDSRGKLKSFASMSDMLHDKMGNLTNKQKLFLAATVGGTDGMRTLLAMSKNTAKQAGALEASLSKQGTAAVMAAKQMGGYKGTMMLFNAAIEEIKIRIGTALFPALKVMFTAFTNVMNSPALKGAMQKAFKAIGEGARQLIEAVKPAAPFFKNVLLPILVGLGKSLLTTVVFAFKIAVGAIKVLSIALGWLGEKLKPAKKWLEAIGQVIGFFLFGWIVKTIKVVSRLKGVFGIFSGAVKAGALKVKNAITIVRNIFVVLGKAGGKVFAGIRAAFSAMVNGLKAAGNGLKNLFLRIWEPLKSGFKTVINFVLSKWNSISFTIPKIDLGPLGELGGGTVSVPQIPLMKSGGSFGDGGAAIVGDRGMELVRQVNGRTLVTQMEGAATKRGNSERVKTGSSSGGDLPVNVWIDGQLVMRAVGKRERSLQIARGARV